MQVETVEIASLVTDPANVRRHPTRNLDAIKGSLQRFGQQRPIVVDEKGVVIAGNGTLAAARELGWPTIQIVRTELVGAEKVAFGIADNRSCELGEWDKNGLTDLLKSISDEDADLAAAAGFSAAELEKLLQMPEQAEPPAEFPEFNEDIETTHECPSCGFRWSGKAGGK